MCATKCPKKVTPAASRGGHLQPPQQQIHQRSLLTKRNFLQNPSTPQKYCISQLDLLRPVKTKAETISLYTEWANHYLEKAGYACFVRDLQNDLRDGKMLISLTHAVVNEKVVLDGSTSSPREVVEACLKVLEEIGVDMQDVTADGIVNGRLKCILGLFFNLSKFKQKMRQCSQPKLSYRLPLVHTHHHHHKQGNAASVAPASLDSPDGDKRYVTPPSSVQSSVLQPYNDLQPSRPVSDHLVMNKSTDSTSRLPVFGMKKGKNCSILPTTGATDPRGPSRKESTGEESTISSLLCPRVNPPRSIRSQKPVKNLQTQRTHPQDTQGSPIGNQPMLGGDLRCAVSSLPKAGQKPPKSGFSVNGGHATEANGIRRGRPSNLPHFSNDVPVLHSPSHSTPVTSGACGPLFIKPYLQLPPPTDRGHIGYPAITVDSAVSRQLIHASSPGPTPTVSYANAVLRLRRPPPSASSHPGSVNSLASLSGAAQVPPVSTPKSRGSSSDGLAGDSPPASPTGEINRAVSQLEDVNPGTWSGGVPQSLPGMSLSPPSGAPPTAASQRSSLGLHVDKEGASVSAGDADNKSIKSECLLPKELSRTARRLGPAVACYSSESSLATPDSWSYSLPIRPFKVDSGSVSKVSPMEGACPLLHPRARADGKEEVDSERVYGPLEFIKLPYDPPRSAMTGADSRDCVKLSTPNFSNGSMKSSVNGRTSEAEINLLRHELEVARQKVATLTSQLEANACVVSNFEQSLADMAQRLQSLTVSAAEKDSELRELRQIIESMCQEGITASVTSPSLRDEGAESGLRNPASKHNDGSAIPAVPRSATRKGGWLRSSFDRAFRRRGSQSSLTGDTNQGDSHYGSQSKLPPPPISAWNTPEHRPSHRLRKNFVRASSVSGDVGRSPEHQAPRPVNSTQSNSCCDSYSRCCSLEAEVEGLRKELADREAKLTDVQLQALASAHQVDQLRDQMTLMFQQLNLLRKDNERLQTSVSSATASTHFTS